MLKDCHVWLELLRRAPRWMIKNKMLARPKQTKLPPPTCFVAMSRRVMYFTKQGEGLLLWSSSCWILCFPLLLSTPYSAPSVSRTANELASACLNRIELNPIGWGWKSARGLLISDFVKAFFCLSLIFCSGESLAALRSLSLVFHMGPEIQGTGTKTVSWAPLWSVTPASLWSLARGTSRLHYASRHGPLY